MSVTDPQPATLSQRELRNESGRVLRAVAGGQSFVLTNGGVPVGRIVPLDAPAAKLPIARPAKRIGDWAALKPMPGQDDRPVARIIDELREDRV